MSLSPAVERRRIRTFVRILARQHGRDKTDKRVWPSCDVVAGAKEPLVSPLEDLHYLLTLARQTDVANLALTETLTFKLVKKIRY